MNIGDISTKITNLTNQDTTSYTNAQRLVDINIWYRNVQQRILKSQDDWDFDDLNNLVNFPIYKANLTANQQDYTLPSGLLQIKRLEVSFDGTNYYKADDFDIGTRNRSVATNNLNDFTTSSPYYDLQGGSLFLYPIPTANVTNGLKIWGTRAVTDFTANDLTAGTASPGFDSLFHDIIAYGAAFEFTLSKDLAKAKSLKIILDEKLAMLENYYGKKAKDMVLSFNPFNSNNSYK